MIVRLARQDGRDAVFDVPAQVIRTAPADPEIAGVPDRGSDASRPWAACARWRRRPTRSTRTFEVKVGLSEPPPEMRLGATVTGRMEVDEGEIISLPASALTRQGDEPAVWVVDPATETVALRAIDVLRFEPAYVVVASRRGARRHRGHGRRAGPAPGPEGAAAGGRAHDRLQPVGLGAAQPLRRGLPDAPRRWSPACSPSSSSAATRTRPSPSAPWWWRPAGLGRRWTRHRSR